MGTVASTLIAGGFASSTLASYLPSFQKYVAFALTLGLAWSLILPPHPHLVIAYCCSMYLCGHTEGTARRAITSLCSITDTLGFPSSGVRSRQLELLLKRYRQLRPSVQRPPRHPLTFPLLCTLLKHIPSIPSTLIPHATLTALLLTLFFGFFRPGELLDRGADFTAPPIRAAFSRSTEASFLRLLASKTDLFHMGVDVLLPVLGGLFCPVAALVAAMRLSPLQAAWAPLFQRQNGSAVSYSIFASVLRLLVQAAGLSHLNITPHSFRIGAATTAAHCGVPDSAIKALGRWQSISYQVYTKYTPADINSFGVQLSRSSLRPSAPYGQLLAADAALLDFDTVGIAFTASQQRR